MKKLIGMLMLLCGMAGAQVYTNVPPPVNPPGWTNGVSPVPTWWANLQYSGDVSGTYSNLQLGAGVVDWSELSSGVSNTIAGLIAGNGLTNGVLAFGGAPSTLVVSNSMFTLTLDTNYVRYAAVAAATNGLARLSDAEVALALTNLSAGVTSGAPVFVRSGAHTGTIYVPTNGGGGAGTITSVTGYGGLTTTNAGGPAVSLGMDAATLASLAKADAALSTNGGIVNYLHVSNGMTINPMWITYPGATTVSVNIEEAALYDAYSNLSIAWNDRGLYSENLGLVLDWGSRELYGSWYVYAISGNGVGLTNLPPSAIVGGANTNVYAAGSNTTFRLVNGTNFIDTAGGGGASSPSFWTIPLDGVDSTRTATTNDLTWFRTDAGAIVGADVLGASDISYAGFVTTATNGASAGTCYAFASGVLPFAMTSATGASYVVRYNQGTASNVEVRLEANGVALLTTSSVSVVDTMTTNAFALGGWATNLTAAQTVRVRFTSLGAFSTNANVPVFRGVEKAYGVRLQ